MKCSNCNYASIIKEDFIYNNFLDMYFCSDSNCEQDFLDNAEKYK